MVRNPNCELCPLHAGAKTVCIEGEGPEDAEVIVIGEAPGKEEDRTGRPFVGQSGQLLREELRKAGFKSVYITNVVKCRPPDNRDPKPAELKACRTYLDQELRKIGSKYVLTLGRFSSKSVLKKSKITLDHGKLVPMPGFTGMPAYHPAYALRDPSKLPALTADLRRLRNEIDGDQFEEPPWKIVDHEHLAQFLNDFSDAGEFSYDVETTSLFPYDGKGAVRCLSIGLEDCAWVIPLEMPGSQVEGKPKAQRAILQILEQMAKDDQKCAIAQNGKFDQHWLKIYHEINFGLDFDTIIASHILDENTDHDLKYLARTELDAPEYDLPLKEKLGSELHTPEGRQRYLKYAALDAAYTLRLKRIYAKRLQAEPGLKRLFYRLMMRTARAIEKIECRGITLDMPKYATTEIQVRKDRDAALATLDKVARKYNDNVPINWNSPAQISTLFYKRLKLKCSVKTKTGNPSTGEDALVELKGQHEVADQLIRYRELEKFLGTYIEGFKPFIHDGKLFLGYKIIGTVTGRFSSRLHQIPRDGTIRNLGVAPTGWEFAQADLSQAELRIAAELSRDLELVSCFRAGGQDVHWRTLLYMIGSGRAREYTKRAMETANELRLGNKDEDITLTEALEILKDYGHSAAISKWKGWKEARKKAKAINFGFIFGMYENKFIQQAKTKYDWDCTYEEAHDFRTAYFELYQGVIPWHNKQKTLVKIDGQVRNLFGRIRRLPGVYSSDRELRSEAERQAINSPVQGTIGDWKSAALVEIEEMIPTSKLRIVGEHHDALLMIFRPKYRDEVLPKVRAIMRRPKLLDEFKIYNEVPMDSEIEIGPWGAGTTYEDPH